MNLKKMKKKKKNFQLWMKFKSKKIIEKLMMD